MSSPVAETAAPRWGVLDAMVGLVVAIFFSTAVAVLVLGSRDYYSGPWSEIGAAAGRAAGQLGARGAVGAPDLVPLWLLTLLQIPLWLGMLGTAFVATRYKGHGFVRDLTLQFRLSDVPIGLAIGVGVQLVVVPLIYTLLFRVIGSRDLSAEARSITDRAQGGTIALLIILTVVAAPFVEEVFFRGLLFSALRRRYALWPAAAVSGVVFGLVHFQLLQLPALVIFGVILAYLMHRFGRLGPAIWAHVGFNATTVAVLLAIR